MVGSNPVPAFDPPRFFSEEPTAVTPHGGILGESQQWLSYRDLHVRFDEGGVETEPRLSH